MPNPNDLMWQPWRVGRKVGRTIYAQLGASASDGDQLIGVMDTPELAALVVAQVNARLAQVAKGRGA
jgi:hypothetical protein